MRTLSDAACAVLSAPDPADKAVLTDRAARAWRDGTIGAVGAATPPDRPARPDDPPLMAPKFVKRRRVTANPAGRIALLHALAHIELNAIDLAWDIVARFCDMPRAFYDDWVGIAAEEAKHFTLLAGRLGALGAAYGDLPAHDGLWQAAQSTAHDLGARLAVVPLVLEARGLDVTPAMIGRLRAVGDDESADILQLIHDEEIGHVAAGRRWFEHVCAEAGDDPVPTYHALVRRHFKGMIKPPFNDDSRARAGFAAAYYAPLAENGPSD